MKLSTRARYALRAVVELALQGAWKGRKTKPVPLSQISKLQGISAKYLRQLFARLGKKGIVRAVRGSRGGYGLARPPERISAMDVLGAIDEEIAPLECVSRPKSCKRRRECPTHPLWCKLADALKDALTATTVAELAERCPRRGCRPLPRGYMFQI
jgi:Rrf2 family protein